MTPFPGTDASAAARAPSTARERSEGALQSIEVAAEGEWRVVQQAGDGEEARFAVYRGARRVAWGIRDRATAIRWLRRLRSAPLPRRREAAESAPAPRSTPERAWWLEHR